MSFILVVGTSLAIVVCRKRKQPHTLKQGEVIMRTRELSQGIALMVICLAWVAYTTSYIGSIIS